VQAHQAQAGLANHRQRLRQLYVPDAMLAALAAGVGLAAVAVPKAGVEPDPDGVAG